MGGEDDSNLLAPEITPWTEEAMQDPFHRSEIKSTQNITQQEQLRLSINGPDQRLPLGEQDREQRET